MPDFFDDFCSSSPRADPGVRMKARGIGYILPLAIFKNVLDVYNFSIISNLFDSNKPYALSPVYTEAERGAKVSLFY